MCVVKESLMTSFAPWENIKISGIIKTISETNFPKANIIDNFDEKIIEVLKVDEKEIEEELEEIKRNAEAKNQMSVNAKPSFLSSDS